MDTPRRLMTRLLSPAEVRSTIAASPAEVYAVLSDPTTYPDWLAGAQHIRHVDADFPSEGARFDHEVGPAESVTVADDSEALIDDPPHRLQLEVHVGPVAGLVDFQLHATGGGTEVVFRESVAGRLGLAMPVLRPLIHARNKASLGRLKDRFGPLIIPLR
jgi:uncharacterized protein YndB with AHSA1/START domain